MRKEGETTGTLFLMEPNFPHNIQLLLIFFLFILLSFRLVSKELRVELKQSKGFSVACEFLEVRAI